MMLNAGPAETTNLSRRLPVHIPLRSELVLELNPRTRHFLGDAAETVRTITDVVRLGR